MRLPLRSFPVASSAAQGGVFGGAQSAAGISPIPFLLGDYPGAAAAYSLRYLSKPTKYSPVVKVRRSSDNAEQDFTALEIEDGSLLAWVGTTASDDGFVTTWYDQSGNSNDATQSTAASQPKIVDAGVLVTEGGKTAIEVSDRSFNINYSAYIGVYSKISVFLSANCADEFQLFVTPNPEDFFLLSGSSSTGFESLTNVSVFKNSSVSVGYRRENLSYAFLGEQALAYFSGDTTNVTFTWVKLADNPRGNTSNIQEIILYPSDQSANRVGIETNINNHYGIF